MNIRAEKFRPNLRQMGPSVATWLHFICGLLALALTSQSVEWFPLACLLLFFSWQLDLLDGKWARAVLKNDPDDEKKLLGDYGDRLDAAIDSNNFALLPAWMAFWGAWHLKMPMYVVVALAVAGLFYTICVQYRLARSNFLIKKSGTIWFWGLPCMAPAQLLASLIAFLMIHSPETVRYTFPLVCIFFVVCGLLCISTVRYSHNKAWIQPLRDEFKSLLFIASLGAMVFFSTFKGSLLDGVLIANFLFWLAYLATPIVYNQIGAYDKFN